MPRKFLLLSCVYPIFLLEQREALCHMFIFKGFTGPGPPELFSMVRPAGELFTWNPSAQRRAEQSYFPRLLRKVSELRQNNKKPLQKHTRKSQKAETIKGLRHTPPPQNPDKRAKTSHGGASGPEGFETVAVADLRTGLSQQFREEPGAEAVGAQKPHLILRTV